ncbi:hypothetical protein D3C85_1142200 [compost metagenome]
MGRGHYLQCGLSGVYANYLFWRQGKAYGAAQRASEFQRILDLVKTASPAAVITHRDVLIRNDRRNSWNLPALLLYL